MKPRHLLRQRARWRARGDGVFREGIICVLATSVTGTPEPLLLPHGTSPLLPQPALPPPNPTPSSHSTLTPRPCSSSFPPPTQPVAMRAASPLFSLFISPPPAPPPSGLTPVVSSLPPSVPPVPSVVSPALSPHPRSYVYLTPTAFGFRKSKKSLRLRQNTASMT